MLSDVAVEVLMDALAGGLTVIRISVLTGIGVDVSLDVNVNAFAGTITLEQPLTC